MREIIKQDKDSAGAYFSVDKYRDGSEKINYVESLKQQKQNIINENKRSYGSFFFKLTHIFCRLFFQ